MGTKIKFTGFIIAVMAISSSIAYADNGGNFSGGADSVKGEHQGHHEKHHLMAQVLNLTEDQQNQLKDIQQKDRETMKIAFEQIKSNRQAFNAEIVKATPDMNKINDLQGQLKNIQSQVVDNRLNSLLEMKKAMSPEQFAGFMALKRAKEIKSRQHHKFEAKCEKGRHMQEHKHWGNGDDDNRPTDAQ